MGVDDVTDSSHKKKFSGPERPVDSLQSDTFRALSFFTPLSLFFFSLSTQSKSWARSTVSRSRLFLVRSLAHSG